MEIIRNYANDKLNIWADFAGKGRKNASGYDVLLSTQKSGGKNKRITITFYGEARDIVNNFARIKLSSLQKVPDKIYFALYATDDSRLGYAIPTINKEPSIRISATAPAIEVERVSVEHKGYYDLKFDENLELYYIDLTERKN